MGRIWVGGHLWGIDANAKKVRWGPRIGGTKCGVFGVVQEGGGGGTGSEFRPVEGKMDPVPPVSTYPTPEEGQQFDMTP
eukprot:750179-Hanusia_phi.AAC.2